MSFQCTACWGKTYDKAWKLQRHVRESKNCFDQINLGMPGNHFVRFRCSSCGYASPRELDVDRHRRRVHGETDDPIAFGRFSTTSADSSTQDSAHADNSMISDLLEPELFEADSAFLNALANIALAPTAEDHNIHTATETYAGDRLQYGLLRNEPQTLPSKNSVIFPGWTPGFLTESVTAPSVHTNPSIHSSPILPSSPKRKSIVTSSSGISQSVNSKGSLFGIPSTHSYKPWMAWSSGSRTQASAAKSLHSNGMPAPMLNSVDEELLLSRGAWTSEERLDYKSSSHLTPQEQFGLAAADDDVERLRLLVEDLAFDCNHHDHEGRTALVWAAERGHHQAVEILLSNPCGGVDVNAQNDRGMTAMMFACYRGDLRILDSLLSVPAIDLGIKNEAGPTAFIIAIQSRDPDSAVVVERLISYVQTRPDYHMTAAKWHPIFNAQDGRGLTPLHWAVKLGQHDCISALLDTKRVNVDMKALDGTTPAMHAIEEIVQPNILEILFDRKACDPMVMNERGETLVGVALRVVRESNNMLADSGRHDIPADRRRLQEARDNLYLCEAYVHHYAGKQDHTIGSSARAGSVL
jgi:ankyrin repeat protein